MDRVLACPTESASTPAILATFCPTVTMWVQFKQLVTFNLWAFHIYESCPYSQCVRTGSTDNCSRLGDSCPEPYGGNGKAECKDGKCGIACNSGYRLTSRFGIKVTLNVSVLFSRLLIVLIVSIFRVCFRSVSKADPKRALGFFASP